MNDKHQYLGMSSSWMKLGFTSYDQLNFAKRDRKVVVIGRMLMTKVEVTN